MNQKTVYILNKASHDFSAAERFGKLVYCTEGTLDKLDVAQMYRQLSAALSASSPDDYILLTSLTSLCSVASAIMADQHGQVNFLIHTSNGYVERTLYLNN